MQYNYEVIRFRRDNKFLVVLHKTTNRQLKIGYDDYLITITAVFSHPSLPFAWYYRIIVTVPTVLP